MSDEQPVYEMLWDCRHCGARKLLGLTHRYCPECGSPQNAEFRYFPSEQDKVAVKDHVYYGTDITCRYCGTYNGRQAKHCKDCGGPLEEGAAATARQDQVHGIGAYAGESIKDAERERRGGQGQAEAPKKKKSLTGILIGSAAIALLGLVLVAVFWKKDASFTVAEQSWQREIDVERFGPVNDSAWCDELPSGAKLQRRYQATRSTEKVKVGEDCQTRKVDQGDGTFKEKRECTPKYESKPVKADKCDYAIDRWSTTRTLKAQGNGTAPEPAWPPLDLKKVGCASLGCEREGSKRETYKVVFKNTADGDTGECNFAQSQWRAYPPGGTFNAKVGVVGSWLDCDSLAAR